MNLQRDLVSDSSKFTLCIDPGVQAVGYAIFRGLLGPSEKTIAPETSGVIRPLGTGWEERAADVVEQLRFNFSGFRRLAAVYVEFQEFWEGSVKSHAAASQGDLFKLSFVVGRMAQLFSTSHGLEVQLISPRTWKGQMNDRAVKLRVQRALGKQYRTHEADAVGIGLHLQGRL